MTVLIWAPTNTLQRKMKTKLCLLISVFLLVKASAQSEFNVLFYNVENLFDVQNDSLTNDDEFTPDGERHWTYKRLNKKLLNTSKAILNASGWEAPTLIALCEIENRYVLERLRSETPLKTLPYKIIHKESPDFRGIDVALLYNSEKFYPLQYEYYPLTGKDGEQLKSREILYVTGVLGGIDTLHVFINHWPSRYSGVMETQELRANAARLLRTKIDRVFDKNNQAKVLIMGDFNDQPSNESLITYLDTQPLRTNFLGGQLYNLSESWKQNTGTIKYQGQWFIFDQVIVSGGLLANEAGIYTKPGWACVCNLPFLLEDDKTYGGLKPFRTYSGFVYNGGFSDHLPILIKLQTH